MTPKKIIVLTASVALFWASLALGQNRTRSAYSYVRETDGQVNVVSEANGSVEARRNLPISAGDSMSTEDPARAEVSMADGNVLQVGGGTQVKFVSLSDQQGSDDEVSAIDLTQGSVILSVVGDDSRSVPRVDTDDLTVYASLGSRVRVNADPRHGSAVIVRAGSVEVRARTGSYTVRAGNYLTVNGEEEPEIARGEFSRDRFDGWAADRLQATESTPTAAGKYVDEEYAGDAQSLDGNGQWDYSADYDTNVWRPNVAAGWSPYSNGSWYYTPAGLTWWSWDPWGWLPFHYGNWFWDVGFNSWCWSPGYVYSPAWCYYGYSGGYFGWCPVGYYNYGHGDHGWNGGGHGGHGDGHGGNWNNGGQGGGGNTTRQTAYAINGRFSTRNVDMRGWNFTNTSNVGSVSGRLPVTAGARVAGRLGDQISVSSRPIVVDRAAAAGGTRAALQEHMRQAPQTIERTAGRDSQLLAPVLARQQNLSRETVDALERRTVVAERGRLSGPGAADIAPRGTTVVERGTDSSRTDSVRRDDRSGRTVITNRETREASPERGRTAPAPERGTRPEVSRPQSPPSHASDTWRGRTETPRTAEPDRGRVTRAPETRAPETREARPSNQQRADAWRQSARPATPREEPVQRGTQSWRSRSDVPPARRVIEGAVPGRRTPDSARPDRPDTWRQAPPSRDNGSRNRDVAPPRREYATPPSSRNSAPPSREFAAPRDFSRQRPDAPPAYRAAPPSPRSSAPPSRNFSPQQAPPAPRSAPSAPSAPSRSQPSISSPRSAPPSHGRPGRN